MEASLVKNRPGHRCPAGYSHLRISLVTRGITAHVIRDTVTSVVTASRGTIGRLPMRGADTTTTRVIRGKIVTQVRMAILYAGGAGAPGWAGRVNQLSSPVRNWVRMGPATWGSARSSHAARSRDSSQPRRWAGESKR